MPTSEPCGVLPVTHFSLSAHYCHQDLAWSCDWMSYKEQADGRFDRLDGGVMRFGPFDTAEDVRAWMLRCLLQLEDLLP